MLDAKLLNLDLACKQQQLFGPVDSHINRRYFAFPVVRKVSLNWAQVLSKQMLEL